MRRRSATTRLIMKASHMLQETVGVLSEPERGAAMRALGTALRRVASCKMRAVSSRQSPRLAWQHCAQVLTIHLLSPGACVRPS